MSNQSDKYEPEAVVIGLKSLIAWRTKKVIERLEVTREGVGDEYVVELTLDKNGISDPAALYNEIAELLPEGYRLNINWIADDS